ncbi:phospholipase D-like domain-containing protein [Microvirga roseola]|uniref:phospholipase D-like domain-containing protein n=1 Tax=Microvirga roseola TaxID=2883126 RepID=UPI001E641C32|nr:phospholipase D-like domain-containing protein [Microvirga roseola]
MERADRFALIVDAADYFSYAKDAMLKARRSILLIGWDFDLRIDLTPADDADKEDSQLGQFMKKLIRQRPDLEIFILKWDMAVVYTLSRQVLPLMALDIMTRGRTHLRFDSTHPWTSAHHQKIVVIDDALAFCGGIDMTTDRWDTRGHLPKDTCRRRPDSSRYGPWHDATAAVDGPAARALGDLARQRWRFATGERLPAVERVEPLWPEGLRPQLRNVEVGIARTMPAYGGRPEIREVESLYLEAIRSATRSIYLESQYFASALICDALADRLEEANGPEIVVVNPRSTEGWLEQETMGVARDVCLERVLRADRHGRFRIFYPVNEAGQPIYVHAKILIVDDRLMRVGSSNINNRSMGFDSECDLAIEAAEPDRATRDAIQRMRNDLLAEHLDVGIEDVRGAITISGSLVNAVEALVKSHGRSLRPLPVRSVNPVEEAVVGLRIADPERPDQPESRLEHAVKRAALALPPKALLAATVGFASGFYMARNLRSPRQKRSR